MGFDNYSNRRPARDNDCSVCGENAYREWNADRDCGCEAETAYPVQECECTVKAAATGRAVRTTRNSECIDGETHVYFESCDGMKEIAMTSECHNEDSLGRVLDVSMTLRNMCPGRRCAVGVHLHEIDEGGTEHLRGFRAITVPAHNASQNRDVALPALRFILPEDLSLACNGRRRHFVVRATNHYIDEDGCGWGNR